MTPSRLIDATPIADDWQLIRIPWEKDISPAPGQWLWLESDGQRFCLPVRDAHADEGWLAGVLPASALPDRLGPGSPIRVSAIMGEAAAPLAAMPSIVIAEDIGIGSALGFAERHPDAIKLVIVGGHHGIPSRLVPSRFYLPTLADAAIAGIGTLESMGIPARIALHKERPGVYEGSVLELLGLYLSELDAEARAGLGVVGFMPWGRGHAADRGGHLDGVVGAIRWWEFPSRS